MTRGRPRKYKKGATINVRVERAEKERFIALARVAGISLSEWARIQLVINTQKGKT